MRLAVLIALTACARTAFNGSRVTVSLFALNLGAKPLTVGTIVSLHTLLPLFFGGIGTDLGMGPVFWSMAACLGAGGLFANRRRAGG